MRLSRFLARTVPVTAAMLLLVIAGGPSGVVALAQSVTGGSSDELARVAVLPFTNISGQPDDEWIGAGIAASLRADLASAASTATVVQDVTQGTADLLAAGRRLGAARVVGGSYQRVGDQLRITARLVDVGTGAVVNSLTIDGTISELFSLQDRIAAGLGLTPRTPDDPGSEPRTATARRCDHTAAPGSVRARICAARAPSQYTERNRHGWLDQRARARPDRTAPADPTRSRQSKRRWPSHAPCSASHRSTLDRRFAR